MSNLDTLKVVDNKFKALELLDIQEEIVRVKTAAFFMIDDEMGKLVDISLNKVNMLANIDLYLFDPVLEDTVYIFRIETNYKLNIYFNSMVEKHGQIIFHLDNNDILFQDTFYKNQVSTAYLFFNSILTGKFNNTSRTNYTGILPLLIHLMEENEIKNHISLEYELLLSEIIRSASDESVNFRLIATDKSTWKDFKMINIRSIPRNFSAFNAISSENIQKGITKVLLNDGKSTTLSPMERIALGK